MLVIVGGPAKQLLTYAHQPFAKPRRATAQQDEQIALSQPTASLSADRRCGPSGEPRKISLPFPIRRWTATGIFSNQAMVSPCSSLMGTTRLKSRTLVTTGQW